ncbi:uncharacterized protein LOC120339814 [Styela clava]
MKFFLVLFVLQVIWTFPVLATDEITFCTWFDVDGNELETIIDSPNVFRQDSSDPVNRPVYCECEPEADGTSNGDMSCFNPRTAASADTTNISPGVSYKSLIKSVNKQVWIRCQLYDCDPATETCKANRQKILDIAKDLGFPGLDTDDIERICTA